MERGLEILDGVELDTAGAQQLQRAARIASARVVVEGYLPHLADSPDALFLCQTLSQHRREAAFHQTTFLAKGIKWQ
jgi:hypothetical protein